MKTDATSYKGGGRAELRASESAVIKVTDHLLQCQQRSTRTDLLPGRLLQYHLLFSFGIPLARLLLHVAVVLTSTATEHDIFNNVFWRKPMDCPSKGYFWSPGSKLLNNQGLN